LKIAIMGSGGIGGYYGARLAQGGSDVTFIARGAHLAAMRDNGLAIEGHVAFHVPKVKATDDPATIGPVDLVLFAVKLRDTESAARSLAPVMTPDTALISFQNGVQKDDMLRPIVGDKALLGGAAYIGVAIARPGAIRKTGPMERMVFGEYDKTVSPRAQAILAACKKAGLNAEISTDIVRELWEKFVFLTAMSSVTAAMRSTIGPIRAHPLTRAFVFDVMKEVVAVGRAHGVALPPDYAEQRAAHLDNLPAEMQASMAHDLAAGKPLELPWLAGAVVDLGAKVGVATPCCRAVRDILILHAEGKVVS
jgi:2-dehydropantoate 2-reductase